MGRPRSEKTEGVRRSLLELLRDGYHLPGQRFYSGRSLARRYGVSYQTADRLIRELCCAGLIERRTGSGTYVAGVPERPRLAALIFNPRAERAGSFGERLLLDLTSRLDALGLPWERGRDDRMPGRNVLPVIWECPAILSRLVASRRPAILLNDRPPAGIAATWIDSVATDDFSGGVVAAELVRRHRVHRRPAVFSGPSRDTRSRQRVSGFHSVFPRAHVVCAGTWDNRHASRKVPLLLRAKPDAIFCCNDRLAQAVQEKCLGSGTSPPVLVGFDDAPVSTRLHLTTVALPWHEIVEGAASLIRRRLAGDRTHTVQLLYAPRPVMRW